MARFFIDRPIFAWVLAIFIMLAGLFSATKLPIEQYPSVSAPTVNISFVYTGASAQTIQDSVISIIEEQMNGVEGLDYMVSQAYSSGAGSIALTFKSGTNEDLAQVDVQNKLSQVEARLPQSVRNTGITVETSGSSFLLFTMLFAEEGSNKDIKEISDYAVRTVKPDLQRTEDVGSVQVFGSEQAMRVWVDPQKLKNYGLSFADVSAAIASQNVQISAGSLGALPAVEGQQFTAAINVFGQLEDVDAFENIVVKYEGSGAAVRIKDVATVEIGNQSYSTVARLNGRPAVGIGVQLTSSGNAVAVAQEIRQKMETMAQYFPEGIAWDIPYDTSLFINLS